MSWFRYGLRIGGLSLLLAACTGMVGTPVQGVPTRTSTSPTLAPLWTPAETKPGPPPGYEPPTPLPTPTLVSAPVAWQEVLLPPPPGAEQIIPAHVQIPTIKISIPAEWQHARMPGAYFIGPSPAHSGPWLVIGLGTPFDDLRIKTPQNIDEFERALIQMYRAQYGPALVVSVQAHRMNVGGYEGVALVPSEGEVCMEVFVPISDRFDMVYRFVFMSVFCHENDKTLDRLGQNILKSVQFISGSP